MATATDLSDKALGIFCFALYHQFTSGDEVTGVIAKDDAGHQADPAGVEELTRLNLATSSDDFITFTPEGQALLTHLAGQLRAK